MVKIENFCCWVSPNKRYLIFSFVGMLLSNHPHQLLKPCPENEMRGYFILSFSPLRNPFYLFLKLNVLDSTYVKAKKVSKSSVIMLFQHFLNAFASLDASSHSESLHISFDPTTSAFYFCKQYFSH